MIRAGQLRAVLYLQQPIIEYGNVSGYEAPINPVLRCEFLGSGNAKQQTGDAGTFGLTTNKVRCRFRRDITYQTQLTDNRVNGQRFDIVGIENVKNLNRELILTLEEQARG
jgi:hypothetical protein